MAQEEPGCAFICVHPQAKRLAANMLIINVFLITNRFISAICFQQLALNQRIKCPACIIAKDKVREKSAICYLCIRMKRFAAIFLALTVFCAASLHALNDAGGLADAAQSPATQTKTVQKSVEALDSKGGALEHAVWGVLAVNFKGDTLAELNKGKCMVPASNMKLVTTAAAYLKLGRDYRFNTTIATDGQIKDSTLCGNLYIIGGGDPLIGNLFSYLPKEDVPFSKWNKILTDNGIARIEGAVVGDGSYFCGELRHSDWSTEDERSKDGVVPSGLTWRGKMGDSIPDGPLAAATHFRRWLIANGTPVSGTATETGARQPSDRQSPDSLTILGTAQSATLNHIASIANHQSDNFCAETLIKAIGKSNNGSDDYDTATTALHRALSPIGLAGPSAGMRFADGSGLSRKNYLSPEFLVSLLRGMARSRYYKDYLHSLPRPGRADGTLKTRLPKAPSAVKDRIYMKSGSMNGVRCFSGYILPSDGNTQNTICFSIMVNNYVGSQTKLAPVLDALILELANEN